jgi:hypothetical protein
VTNTLSSKRWRVYYGDGSVVDWRTPLEDVRGEDVIVIVQSDDAPGDQYAVGRELLYDADYYCWRDGGWFRCDLYGLFDYLRQSGLKKVLAGRWVPRHAYKAALSAAFYDPDFPVKTANQAGEVER